MADVNESAKSVTASLWLERAEKHNPILPTPGSPMPAAVAEEMEEYADRKLAEFLATRAAPPAMDREAVKEALFLLDRLDEFARDIMDDDTFSAFDGHVSPSAARLRMCLSALSADAIRQGEGMWRHVKRGTIYEVIGTAELQAGQPQLEHAELVIYRGEDGKLWARNSGEFHDGRFVPATPAPAVDAKARADIAAALRNTPAEALRESGYLERAAKMIEAPAVDAVPAGEVELSNPRQYTVGPLTMDRVFRAAGLTNMADMQAVLDAIEAALSHGEGRK